MSISIPPFLNLAKEFGQYFRVVPAHGEELKREAFRIRHRVYCEELGYEEKRPDGLESDEYDRHCLHCLLWSRKCECYIGCIRLVLARPEDPHCPLPFERTCAAVLDRTILDPSILPRHRIAEVSRLAVVAEFRKRKGDQGPFSISEADYGGIRHPRFPYIPVGLYLGMIALAQMHGIEDLFVLTEARLVAHLRRLGVDLRPIGDPVEHRGTRVPSTMNVDHIVHGFNMLVRPLFELIRDEVEGSYSKLERVPAR